MKLNAVVLGASFDDVEANRAFAEKYDFPFVLLSDTDRDVGIKYGAAGKKEHQYAKRISYLIDPDGNIARAYPKVDVNEHPAEVIRDIEALSG